MARYIDSKEKLIESKKEKAKRIFEELYTRNKERESKKELLTETLEQIEVCEGLCRTVTEEQIEDMLNSRNVIELSRKARKIKFA